jgi:hypothetical protein
MMTFTWQCMRAIPIDSKQPGKRIAVNALYLGQTGN